MTNKHTPGPWFIDTSLHVYGSSEPRPLDGVPGGTVIDNPHVCTAKTCADARLIAAAPELLEMLQKAVKFGGLFPDLAEEARAAIAKATGQ